MPRRATAKEGLSIRAQSTGDSEIGKRKRFDSEQLQQGLPKLESTSFESANDREFSTISTLSSFSSVKELRKLRIHKSRELQGWQPDSTSASADYWTVDQSGAAQLSLPWSSAPPSCLLRSPPSEHLLWSHRQILCPQNETLRRGGKHSVRGLSTKT